MTASHALAGAMLLAPLVWVVRKAVQDVGWRNVCLGTLYVLAYFAWFITAGWLASR